MTRYYFKKEDTERMVNQVLKDIGPDDISVKFNFYLQEVTIEPKKRKQPYTKKWKRQLSKIHRGIIWKKFCGWVDRKGYWLILLVLMAFAPVFIPDWRGRLGAGIALAGWALIVIINDE